MELYGYFKRKGKKLENTFPKYLFEGYSWSKKAREVEGTLIFKGELPLSFWSYGINLTPGIKLLDDRNLKIVNGKYLVIEMLKKEQVYKVKGDDVIIRGFFKLRMDSYYYAVEYFETERELMMKNKNSVKNFIKLELKNENSEDN